MYTARAELLVGPISSDADTLTAAGLLAGTYTQLIQTGEVVDPTIEELGAAIEPEGSWGEMAMTANGDTRIVTVALDSNDPNLAARITNLLIENLQTVVASRTSVATGAVTVLEEAVPPTSATTPRPLRAAVVGAAAALAAAIAIAVVVEALRLSRPRRRARKEALTELP